MATTPAGRVAVSRRICWIWRRRLKAQSLMNAPFDPTLMVSEKFAVGQPVSRKEDPTLLRGEGRYSDDPNLPGQLYGVMVRSRMARGELRSIDTDAAREMPGVHMVVTAADLDAAGIKNTPAADGKHRDGTPTPNPWLSARSAFAFDRLAPRAQADARDHFQKELAFLGIESSPAFVRAPECNGCAERFIRTLKENLLQNDRRIAFRETCNAI